MVDGTDASLFVLIRRGLYTWPTTPRKSASTAEAAEPASIVLRDIVSGLLRQSVPKEPSPPSTHAERQGAVDDARWTPGRQPSIGKLRLEAQD